MKFFNINLKLNSRYLHYLAYVLVALNLNAATLFVGPPPASIQSVIDSASPGDTVQLSSGTYVEEILINKDLTLVGNGIGVSIIQCPTTPNPLSNTFVFIPTGATYHPFVMVEGAENVNIEDLTVDGNSQASNFLSYRFEGIGYHNAGGTIQNVHSTNVQDQSPGGSTQHGFGIAAAADDATPHTIYVIDSIVDNFQKAGIDIRGSTLTAYLSGNTVTGENPSSTANANGIVVQFGAQVSISSNTITHLKSTVLGNDAVGILLSGAGANSSIINNISNDSDLGIYSANALGDLLISDNIVNDNSDIGIYVQDTSGTSTISNNILTDNINYNLYIVDTIGNHSFILGQNQFIGSQYGLSVEGSGSSGPLVSMNADEFTGSTVYYIQEISAPNDIWPSTASVYFDGLISGHISVAEYNQIRTKILDQRSPVADPSLGLVLDYVVPATPTVTSVSPNSGPSAGGTSITISGSNFTSSDTHVFFGTTEASSLTLDSDSSITVVSPPGTGIVDVTVVTPFGSSALSADDKFAYAPMPPVNFKGLLLGRLLISQWNASPSPDVVSYRVYRNDVLVSTILANQPRIFVALHQTRPQALQHSVAAVDSAGTESARVAIQLLN